MNWIKNLNINFLKPAKFLTPLAVVLSFVALICIINLGFNYGIDFSGGNEIQVRFQENVLSSQIKKSLFKIQNTKASIQKFGTENEFLIRVEASENEEENNKKLERLLETLKNDFLKEKIEIRRIDSVGPQIGKELRRNGILALIYSLIMILIYLGLRFDNKYAPSAVFCLFHDAMITMSLFSIFKLEVNVQTVAAILAIIGYSLNDTIVTFDRIRENSESLNKKKSFFDICNQSLNEVLSRTLLTSLTTFLALLAMYIFADGVIKDFAFTLIIGILVGTYSSIYVATPLLLYMNRIQKSSFLHKIFS
ncbi:MAG: protein translocase subunit SecF [Bdellovibrionales bacterium]|nr:protein translocase subunit SecF [Bdellovibrionales bacterium]